MKTRILLASLLFPVLGGHADQPASAVDLCKLSAWKAPTGEWATAAAVEGSAQAKSWKSIGPAGDAILYNGAAGKTVNLTSTWEHGDVEATIEFMVPAKSNSGIYFQDRYEIQILDSFGKPDRELTHGDCGGIYQRWDPARNPKGYEGTAPRSNASRTPGSWQILHVRFRAPRFDPAGRKTENARFVRVELNGTVIHENVEVTGPTRGGMPEAGNAPGPIRLQGDHGLVAFRKILVAPARWD